MIRRQAIRVGYHRVKLSQEVEAPNAFGQTGILKDGTIKVTIHPDQPKVEKYLTLLHEFLHACDDMLIAERKIKKPLGHARLDLIALRLGSLLVRGGFLRGVTPRELDAYTIVRDTSYNNRTLALKRVVPLNAKEMAAYKKALKGVTK